MAKLTVKNVGPIREAELEVKKHTVFIGPQGSGKSTLAKLIAIGGDEDILPNPFSSRQLLLDKYNIDSYVHSDSIYKYETLEYNVYFEEILEFQISGRSQQIQESKYSKQYLEELHNTTLPSFEEYKQNEEQLIWSKMADKHYSAKALQTTIFRPLYNLFLHSVVLNDFTLYAPAERFLISILSDTVWGLLNNKVNLPKSVTLFGSSFELTRCSHTQLNIPFLQVKYERKNEQDYIEYRPGQSVLLSQSASGYQSIIPLLLVIEHQRRQATRRFIIEEPELNLYPTAQKDLIYNLVSGLQPDVEYQEASWVFTTHSPYILTSLNTLMLAYKVAQRSEELRAEVEKIIPSRCWINPDEFAAYYVDNGTAGSITNPETGLINDSRLDDVSEDFAGEQDKLFALYRTALVND